MIHIVWCSKNLLSPLAGLNQRTWDHPGSILILTHQLDQQNIHGNNTLDPIRTIVSLLPWQSLNLRGYPQLGITMTSQVSSICSCQCPHSLYIYLEKISQRLLIYLWILFIPCIQGRYSCLLTEWVGYKKIPPLSCTLSHFLNISKHSFC